MEQMNIEEVNAKEIKPFSITNYVEQRKALITILIGLVGLFAPFGYLSGVIYHTVYLETFGVNAAFFPISTQDAYINAYLVITAYINKATSAVLTWNTLYIITAALIFFLSYIYVVAKGVRKAIVLEDGEVRLKPYIEKIANYLSPKNNTLTAALVIIYDVIQWIGTVTLVTLLLVLFWIYVFIGSYEQAETNAQTRLKRYFEKGCTFSDKSNLNYCTKIVNSKDETITEGYIIAALGNKVAIFNESGSSIRVIQPTERLLKPRQQIINKAL